MSCPVFRFAPSPNGHLHLGHALSALLNAQAARRLGGRFLLRIEDIDRVRCTPELENDMLDDLAWLGVAWDGPVLRQSDRFDAYRTALTRLEDQGLVYKGGLSRAEIKRHVADFEAGGRIWPRDPDGAPHYPGDLAVISSTERDDRLAGDAPFALRLDMARALELAGPDLAWTEAGCEGDDLMRPGRSVRADAAAWGDVVLARKDTPTSYHLSVVVDDADQGVTDVLRGLDLYAATAVHRLLQDLLGLPAPVYRHHRLILGPDGRKLSKSTGSTSLRALRAEGMAPSGICRLVGL